jgi:hypothetical protein
MTKSFHRGPVLRSSHRRASVGSAQRNGSPRRARAAADAHLLEQLAATMTRLARASSNLAVGYAVIARHARDEELIARCALLATLHRTTATDLAALLAQLGPPPPRLTPTCGERLRWEWLASAARLTDGAADARLLAECARVASEAGDAVASLVCTGVELPSALRRIVSAFPSLRAEA